MADKNVNRIVNDLAKEPLHIKSLNNQVSWNPRYLKVADSLVNQAEYPDLHNAYFYALKDAYEKNGYNPNEGQIRSELSDRYWSLADSYKDRRGYSGKEWDNYGWGEFEEEYGNEESFINKFLDAYKKNW